MSRPSRSLFWRLVAGMVAVSLLAVLATVAFLYVRFDSVNSRFREGTLRSYAELLAREVAVRGAEAGRIAASGNGALDRTLAEIAHEGGRFAIVQGDGGLAAASPGLDAPLLPPQGEDEPRYFTLPDAGRAEPTYGLSLRVPGSEPPVHVQVAFPGNHVLFDSVLEEFVVDIAWIWLPFMLAILAMNIVVARIALKPLQHAARQAEAIGPHSVAVRLSEEHLPTDVLVLVRAVNYALARLQEGYRAMEDFVSDVAHELRTPLAIIKAQLSASDAPVARDLERDFAGMERLVQQLLDRVRLGGIHFEPDSLVDLSDVARETAAYLAPLAVARQRSVELIGADRPIVVAGARDFIARALRNLIENAIEHTRPGTTVTVLVGPGPAVSVLDCGPGFPPARLGRGSQRDNGLRSDRQDGVGLGLWIVERTMTAHSGSLRLSAREGGGACATMDFAAAPAEEVATSGAATEIPYFEPGTTRCP